MNQGRKRPGRGRRAQGKKPGTFASPVHRVADVVDIESLRLPQLYSTQKLPSVFFSSSFRTRSVRASSQMLRVLSSGEARPPPSKKPLPIFLSAAGSQGSLTDMKGIDATLQRVRELFLWPVQFPETFERLGLVPPRGVLLYGPPGVGKTMLANLLGCELQMRGTSFLAVQGALLQGPDGEKKAAEAFAEASARAPCVLFIDGMDGGKPERMSHKLAALIDTAPPDVSVVAAAVDIDRIPSDLRRPRRLEIEVAMNVPDRDGRACIMDSITRTLPLTADVSCEALAALTPGFTGGDLQLLAKEAALSAARRALAGSDELHFEAAQRGLEAQVSMSDFHSALLKIRPAVARRGFAAPTGVTWSDVGALADAREVLERAVALPLKRPDLFKKVGINQRGGVLLHGPPGCGKTLLARALAGSAGLNFISVKGPELLSMYVGESERAVRDVFTRARLAAPCVVFFDELDALCPKRGGTNSSAVSERVVNQLLTEMDGLGPANQGVFILGATNRPDLLDPAILRPGRMDTKVSVHLPGAADRRAILRAAARRVLLHESVDLDRVAEDARLDGFSGADLASLVREAALHAISDAIAAGADPVLRQAHFELALGTVRPSVARGE